MFETPTTPTKTPKTHKDTPKAHDDIKALCAYLTGNISYAPCDETALSEQIQVLNAMFHATLAEQLNLAPGRYELDDAKGWLEIALKVQKQCMDTVRTQKSVKYMDSLIRPVESTVQVEYKTPRPHPPKMDERKEGDTNI